MQQIIIIIIIIYHDFLPTPRRGSHVKSDKTHTVIKIHPLAHILDAWALIFSSCAFYSLSQPHHVTASVPSPCDNHQSTGGRSDRTQGQAKMAGWNSFSYICTRALHSFRSFAHCRAASTAIPLLPKATLTPSILPNLGSLVLVPCRSRITQYYECYLVVKKILASMRVFITANKQNNDS